MTFTKLEQLGGPASSTWRARLDQTGAIVTIKPVPPAYRRTSAGRDYLDRLLVRSSQLRDPRVARLLGYGPFEGATWLAREYADGTPLTRQIADRTANTWAAAAPLIRQIASGLALLHAAGMAHLNLKPSNVIVGPGGLVTLTDNGLGAGTASTPGQRYRAPEGAVDARSDLYSLGVIAADLLVNRRGPISLDGLPFEAQPLIGWLIQENPLDRPKTAADVIAALEGRIRLPGAGKVGALTPAAPFTQLPFATPWAQPTPYAAYPQSPHFAPPAYPPPAYPPPAYPPPAAQPPTAPAPMPSSPVRRLLAMPVLPAAILLGLLAILAAGIALWSSGDPRGVWTVPANSDAILAKVQDPEFQFSGRVDVRVERYPHWGSAQIWIGHGTAAMRGGDCEIVIDREEGVSAYGAWSVAKIGSDLYRRSASGAWTRDVGPAGEDASLSGLLGRIDYLIDTGSAGIASYRNLRAYGPHDIDPRLLGEGSYNAANRTFRLSILGAGDEPKGMRILASWDTTSPTYGGLSLTMNIFFDVTSGVEIEAPIAAPSPSPTPTLSTSSRA